MAARRKLSDLLADVDSNDPNSSNGMQPDRSTQDEADDREPAPSTDTGEGQSATPKRPDKQTSEVPKYRTLDRKELLARPDQLEELFALRRRLNKRRAAHEGERITENTLIRVAIDLLLAGRDALEGTTEYELRESVTRRLREEGEDG